MSQNLGISIIDVGFDLKDCFLTVEMFLFSVESPENVGKTGEIFTSCAATDLFILNFRKCDEFFRKGDGDRSARWRDEFFIDMGGVNRNVLYKFCYGWRRNRHSYAYN